MSTDELMYLPIRFILTVGATSNLLLMVCFLKDPLKCLRNSATYLIMNLALSDFVTCSVALVEMPVAELYSVQFYVTLTAMFVSLFSIFSIAVDRYILTVHPFKHRTFINRKRISICIGLIWLLSCCPMINGLLFHLHPMETAVYDTFFISFTILTGFIYLRTYFSLKRQRREMRRQNQSRSGAMEKMFLKTIMIVAFIQIFTLVPVSVFGLVVGWSFGNLFPNMIVLLMYHLNFAVNPFLYLWRLKNYRQTFRLVFCKKLG